jgi:RNA polymerase sigma-70 factor (ECF subfamily)
VRGQRRDMEEGGNRERQLSSPGKALELAGTSTIEDALPELRTHDVTALLIDIRRVQWQDRAHFFAVSAQVMRRILVDYARRHNVRRGRGIRHVSLEDVAIVAPGEDAETDLVALDEALIGLTRIDPRKSQIVEMRFFGGLTVEEIGEVLKVSPGTIKRDWRAAKAWLYQELTR